MFGFIFFYSLLYLLFQSYLLLSIKNAFLLQGKTLFYIGGFLVLAMYFPLLQRIFLHIEMPSLSLFFHIAGYFSMVFSFLFPFFHILTFLLTKISGFHSPQRTFYLSMTLLSLFILYGSIEKDMVTIKKHSIDLFPGQKTKKIRITQISDVHIDMLRNKNFLKKVKDMTSSTDPDIVVATGDILDGLTGGDDIISGLLKDIKATTGKYAVIGNHEVYSDLDRNIKILTNGGFKILRQETVEPIPGLIIGGVDDPAVNGRNKRSINSYKDIFKGLEKKENALILLKHQPVPYIHERKPHLQLSGHTHGGQVFPFGYFVYLRYGYVKGMYKLAEDFYFYISPGTGTWGPPIRVLSRPEISVFDITIPR